MTDQISAMILELVRVRHAETVVNLAIALTLLDMARTEQQRVRSLMDIEFIHMDVWERNLRSDDPIRREIATRRYARHQATAIGLASQ